MEKRKNVEKGTVIVVMIQGDTARGIIYCEWRIDKVGYSGLWKLQQTRGPNYGYFLKPSKIWLTVKLEHLERAKELFADSDINITDQGHLKYQGSYIGSDGGAAEFVKGQVKKWIINVNALAKVAKIEPQLAYAELKFMECQRSGALLLGLLLTYQNI